MEHQPESVWDYPRPPRIEPTASRIVVELGGAVVADTTSALRVLETSQPPAYYVPLADVHAELTPVTHRTFCEWKGLASYWDVTSGGVTAPAAAWGYEDPTGPFLPVLGHVAFYAQHMARCTVDGEVVQPNPGAFYGGWITSWITGPFKGGPGTAGW